MATDYAKTMDALSPYEYYPYASFIKGRAGGDWKRHKTLAHAKSAVAQSGYYTPTDPPQKSVYEWVGDKENGYWVGVDA